MSDDGQVKSIIDRVQRLQEEKRTIEDDIKEVYAEARANGYDVKVLRAVVKHLGRDQGEVAEFDAIFDLYLQAYQKAGAAPSRAQARDAGARTREAAAKLQTIPSGSLPAAQNEAAAGASPEQGSAACAAGVDEGNSAHADQFVTPAGEEEGVAPPVDPSPVADGASFMGGRKPFILRPHCRRPEMCGSYGSKHCGPCERAAKEADGEDDGAGVPAFVRSTHRQSQSMGDQA